MKCEKEVGGMGWGAIRNRLPLGTVSSSGQTAGHSGGLWITFPIIFFSTGESVIGAKFGECDGARNYTC